jgi:hypothetical protein
MRNGAVDTHGHLLTRSDLLHIGCRLVLEELRKKRQGRLK